MCCYRQAPSRLDAGRAVVYGRQMRRLLVPALVGCALLSGCLGDTDPASHLRATRAQLNAHGRTNNGPATFWWEYGTRRTAVAGGQGTRTPRRGPATSAAEVPLSEAVNGLQPDQPYYFRACGQDTAAGSPVTCGQVRRFRTSPADSTIGIVRPAGALAHVTYVAAPAVRHDVAIYAYKQVVETLQDATGQDPPLLGATLAAGPGCQVAQDARGYLVDATCSDPALGGRVVATMGPFADRVEVPYGGAVVHLGAGDDTLEGHFRDLPEEAYGEAGDDQLRGGEGNDFISGGEGDDFVAGGFGADGGDVLEGGPGHDSFYCDGPGDVALVDQATEYAQAVAVGCTAMFVTAARRAAAREAQAQ